MQPSIVVTHATGCLERISFISFSLPEKPKEMEDHLFSEKFACPVCNISLPDIEPRIFSFNTPHGACPACAGLGRVLNADPDLIFNDNLTINEGGIVPFFNITSNDTWFSRTFRTFCEENHIPTDVYMKDLSKEQKDLLEPRVKQLTTASHLSSRMTDMTEQTMKQQHMTTTMQKQPDRNCKELETLGSLW